MFDLFRLWCGAIIRTFRGRRGLMLENLALRQQLAVLKRKHPRPQLGPLDKLFWVLALRFWSRWKETLFLVLPETVVRWHRAGFRRYWAMLRKAGKRVGGGRRISKQIRELIFRMVAENPAWGAPRMHGELLMLGFDVSESTISRWMRRAPRNPELGKRWLAFLLNHREAIAAMDFFTVPTVVRQKFCTDVAHTTSPRTVQFSGHGNGPGIGQKRAREGRASNAGRNQDSAPSMSNQSGSRRGSRDAFITMMKAAYTRPSDDLSLA